MNFITTLAHVGHEHPEAMNNDNLTGTLFLGICALVAFVAIVMVVVNRRHQ